MGRESFLWHLPAIRQVDRNKPVVLICRGAYINRLVGSEPVDWKIREQLTALYRGCDLIICIDRHQAESLHRAVGVAKFIFASASLDAFSAINSARFASCSALCLAPTASLNRCEK